MKALLRWCRYYYLVNPLINTVIHKMSEYPITEIIIDEQDPIKKERWEEVLGQHLRYRAFQIEVGLDYYTYGMCATSIHFPFTKYLICSNCGFKEKASKSSYKWRNLDYVNECTKCNHYGPTKVQDFFEKDLRRIRLQRWNPEYINIDPGFAGADPIYTFDIPLQLRNDILLGKKNVLDTIPDVFVEAMRRNKFISFSPENIFVMKRPIISQKDAGWGMPLIFPVLKDTFYLQILRKAQECVSPSTLIETSSGLIKADEVKVGDLVRTHLGRWRKVENKWYRDAKEEEIGTEITLSGLRPFSAVYSPHHPILTLQRNDLNRRSDTLDKQRSSVILKNPHLWEEVICPAEKFVVGDYVLYPKSLPSENQTIDVARYTGLVATDSFVYSGVGEETAQAFEKLEAGEQVLHDNAGRVAKRTFGEDRVPKRMAAVRTVSTEMAYILGWYVGDGSCGSRHVTFNLEDGVDDPTALKAAIKQEFNVDVTEEVVGSLRNVVLSDVIVRLLIKGLIPGTARVKQIPHEILNAPDEQKLAFLRGYWEADGALSVDCATLSTSSFDLAYGAYRLLLHFGCIATVSQHNTPATLLRNGRIIKASEGYHVTVSSASRDRLVSLWECGHGQVVESGKSGFFWKGYFASRISAIAEVEEAQYIDFKVEEDSTFCTAGTATKNSIAQEHIVPLRVLFPQAGSASSDPYTTVSLESWKTRMEGEIAKWKYDNNYIPILPLPIGNETIGGDGKALGLYQEMDVWSKQIVAGMGVPQEFVWGGMQYSGSNVSMRMLENMFIGYRTDHENMLNQFVIKRIASFMEWTPIKAHMRRFKMADDLQRCTLYFQLNQAQKISDQTLLNEVDQDFLVEEERKKLELSKQLDFQRKMQLSQANTQAEAQVITMKAQMKMQQEQMAMQGGAPGAQPGVQPGGPLPGAPGGQPGAVQPGATGQEGEMLPGQQVDPAMPQGSTVSTENAQQAPQDGIPLEAQSPITQGQKGGGMNLLYLAKRAANALQKQDKMTQMMELNRMKATNPQLYMLVMQIIQDGQGSQANPLDASQSPLPEQKPSRRVAPVG